MTHLGSREGKLTARGRLATIILDEIIQSNCEEPFDTTKRILERLTHHKLVVVPSVTEEDPWKLAHPSTD